MDTARLRENFKLVAQHGDQVPLYFYSRLFVLHPGVHDMFPVSMAAQRKRFVRALIRIVSEADRADTLAPFLRRLGAGHRKFGTLAGHYGPVGEVLLATLEHFSGEAWNEDLAADWAQAYGLVARIMQDAAAEDERHLPATWAGTVIAARRPLPDVTVLTVAADPSLTWRAGQYVTLETPARPREWRRYCPANLPDGDGTLELHVRTLGRGGVSDALALAGPGAPLRLGPAAGRPDVDLNAGRDLVMAAASAGIAPCRALLAALARLPSPPLVLLFYGGAAERDLYDLEDVAKMAARCPWLTAVPVVTAADGPVSEVIARDGTWAARDAYLAGPADFTGPCAEALAAAGTPPDRIRVRSFRWREAPDTGKDAPR
jgi:NAD(P)H-flavin reductase/hemoglobin-like flavoprotein